MFCCATFQLISYDPKNFPLFETTFTDNTKQVGYYGQSIDTIPLALALKDQFDILVVYGEKEADELEYDEALSHRGDFFKDRLA